MVIFVHKKLVAGHSGERYWRYVNCKAKFVILREDNVKQTVIMALLYYFPATGGHCLRTLKEHVSACSSERYQVKIIFWEKKKYSIFIGNYELVLYKKEVVFIIQKDSGTECFFNFGLV